MADTITVNGTQHPIPDDPRVSLLDFLRRDVGLTGTKKGCDHGQCGACTVIVNGIRINSCLTLAAMHDGDSVTTIEGLGTPEPFVANDADIAPNEMVDTDGAWATTRFMDHDDLRHDMHITIVTLQPGAVIPFAETHVMEHGLFVLEGKAVYHLNQDWVEVEAGDFMWLRAFCPQACYAGGPGPFRYLLYKDVNRHMPFL